MPSSQSAFENKLLRHMPAGDFDLLAPYLEPQTLPLRYSIEVSQTPVSAVFFLETGLASIVVKMPDGRDIEVGISGNDGMTGPAVILGGKQSPHDTYVQIAGHGFKITVARLHEVMEASKTLRDYLLLYVQTMVIQTASTALANGQADVPARMARWLLMVHDRIDGANILLTHEFLAVMLGVRRPWVTEILHLLEDKRLIRAKRGQITIVDRKGLVSEANGFYGVAEAEYKRLLGINLSR
ncbi:cyclic nucleotide-binding protein [Phyllobacterium zundukense]|uniref:Cyclic nucleotide-binding protein n=2 Tax=Phyllobacterium zundukense TaxID=1867719 RepID=A0A2N9VSY2_9HYPH|nr:cyclic nucleotide-binding protein [Phyllobacterium zundukense]PIO42600.1 cyclic nucleotide-binding protein [Phyllobacterium zundukense]